MVWPNAVFVLVLVGAMAPFQQTTSFAQMSKPLPVIAAKAFTAKFMMTNAVTGKFSYATEKFDEVQQKARLSISSNDGIETTMIFDYADSLIIDARYSITNDGTWKCVVYPMSVALNDTHMKSDFRILGGYTKRPSADAIPHMFSTKDIFTLNTTAPFTYKGPATVEGIPANHWSAPMKWGEEQDTFTVNYYFTSDMWQVHNGRSVQPLRIEVVGTKTLPSGKTAQIHRYYDYLDFQTFDVLSPDDFDIPHGRHYCPSLFKTPNKDVPKFPDALMYTKEVIDRSGNVEVVDVTYDKRNKVLTQDYRDNAISVVYEITEGLKFNIDRANNTCSVAAIAPESDLDVHFKGNYVADVGPPEFKVLRDIPATYMGLYRTRQIDSLLWVDRNNTSGYRFAAFFGEKNWNFHDGFSDSYGPPLTLHKENYTFNFFHFHSFNGSRRSSYVLSRCRGITEGYTYVDIVLEKIRFGFLPELNYLSSGNISMITTPLAQKAGVSPMRINLSLRTTYTKRKRLYTGFYIFGPVLPSLLYRKLYQSSVQKSSSILYKTSTLPGSDYSKIVDLAARSCENSASDKGFTCRNFDICKAADGSHTLTMYNALPSSSKIEKSSSCDLFMRSADTKPAISLEKAISNLQLNIKKGLVKLNITLSGRLYDLVATEMNIRNISAEKYQERMSKENFLPSTGKLLEKTETVKGVRNWKTCSARCLARTDFRCVAFQFCYATNQCFLSKSKPDLTDSTPTIGCNIAVRNYLKDYQPMAGMALGSQNINDKNTYGKIVDDNDCARMCTYNFGVTCESFDYCSDTKMCVLRASHLYSLPSSSSLDTSLTCTHYSKNYVLDFDVSINTKISTGQNNALKEVKVDNPEKCAYLCQTGYGAKGCVQFDFCSDTGTCRIASSNLEVGHVRSSACSTYTIKDAQRARLSQTQASSTSYSDASYGGLAFAMLLLGLLVGAVLVFGFYKSNYNVVNKVLA